MPFGQQKIDRTAVACSDLLGVVKQCAVKIHEQRFLVRFKHDGLTSLKVCPKTGFQACFDHFFVRGVSEK
jgi:hypothetical protein